MRSRKANFKGWKREPWFHKPWTSLLLLYHWQRRITGGFIFSIETLFQKCFFLPLLSSIWEYQHKKYVRHGECFSVFWADSEFCNLYSISNNFFICSTYNMSQENKISQKEERKIEKGRKEEKNTRRRKSLSLEDVRITFLEVNIWRRSTCHF